MFFYTDPPNSIEIGLIPTQNIVCWNSFRYLFGDHYNPLYTFYWHLPVVPYSVRPGHLVSPCLVTFERSFVSLAWVMLGILNNGTPARGRFASLWHLVRFFVHTQDDMYMHMS